jgi:hypothetical protein
LFLIADQVEDGEDKKGSKVLNVEDVIPADLFAEVFKGEFIIGWNFSKFKGSLIIRKNDFFVIGLIRELLLMIRNFG